MKIYNNIILFFLLALSSQKFFGQDNEEIDRWDNWFLLGNKLVIGGDKSTKHSHELQWRVNNNMRQLKEWYYEGVFTYSPNGWAYSFTPMVQIIIRVNKEYKYTPAKYINF